MDLRKIKKLIELVEESGISELEVKSADEAVRIVRPVSGAAAVMAPAPAAEVSAEARPVAAAAADIEVRAPMAGTFYAASEPGAEPFVVRGQDCDADAVVCIIESMKMMNEIRLPEAGQCVDIQVTNGEPVSARQLLFRFRSGA